jgi:T3SS negative regulator,GrlR
VGFDQTSPERLSWVPGPDGRQAVMIRNGLYHITVEMLDGIDGGNQGVMVLRDGTMRGGDSFFYAYGIYTAASGKWKGEVTNQEHSPTFGARPVWERKVVTIGFTGTYTDEAAQGDGIALAGKQSIRFKSKLRLLIPD